MSGMKKHQFLHIEIHTTVKFSAADKRKMQQWLSWSSEVLQTLAAEKLFKKESNELNSLRVSLLVAGEARIRKLNRDYRGKDKSTDVLSFPAIDNLREAKLGPYLNNGELFLGDVAICSPVARRQAKEFSISFWDEFIHLFFHGVLHLIGYDHELSAREEKIMQKWEQRALELFSKIKNKKGTKGPL
jgi:probable rRNA maturation factor